MPRYTAELRRRAVAAVARGRSQRAVATELGISRSTLASWIRQSRMPMRAPVAPSPDAAEGAAEGTATSAMIDDEPRQAEASSDHIGPAPRSATSSDAEEPDPVTEEIPVVRPVPAEAVVVGGSVSRPPSVPVPATRVRRRSVVLIAAAAMLVLVVVAASVLVRGQRVNDVDASYDDLVLAVNGAYEQARTDTCSETVEVVGTLSIFDRAATASLTHLAIVAAADDAFDRAVRSDVETARSELVDDLIAAVPTPEQREVQARFGASDDVLADCLASTSQDSVEPVANPSPTDVRDLEELLPTIESDGVATGNLADIRSAILAIMPVVRAASDGRITPASGLSIFPPSVELDDAEAALVESVEDMGTRGTPSAVLDATSLLADYAFVGEAMVGDVIVTEGVEVRSRPSIETPLVTPEPEIAAAVEDIPAEIGPPPPGPQPDPLPADTGPTGDTGAAGAAPGTTSPTTRPGTTSPSTTLPSTSTPSAPSTTTPATTDPRPSDTGTTPGNEPGTVEPTPDEPDPTTPATTDPEPEPTTPEPTDPEPTDPETTEPAPPESETTEPSEDEPEEEDEDCLVDLLGVCVRLP